MHLRDVHGAGDRRVGRGRIADLPVVDQVAVRLRVKLRRVALQRLDGVGYGVLLVIDDLDGLGGVAGLSLGLGDDDRHRVADIAHAVHRQRRPGAHLHRRAVLGMDHPAADEVADAVGLQFPARQNGDDAGHLLRRGHVDADDVRMRVRRAHEHGVLHSGHDHVVDIAPPTGDESLVFLARYPRADAFNSHGRSPPEQRELWVCGPIPNVPRECRARRPPRFDTVRRPPSPCRLPSPWRKTRPGSP